MKLLLVRHGSTPYNEQGRYTGQSDIPLSALGEHQASLLGERLASESIDAIVSSDLQRTRATAQAIAQYHGLPVYEDANLREVDLGQWEGNTFAAMKAEYPDQIALWRMDSANSAPHGGESISQVRDRVVPTLAHWQARYPKGTVVWVTHGGVIGMLICHLLSMNLSRRLQFRCSNASITRFDLGGDFPILAYSNDTAHLRTSKETSEGQAQGPAPTDQVLGYSSPKSLLS